MAKYTIELRQLVDSGKDIFPFAYDFYDEKERVKFEEDFIRHFYFREIGVETYEQFVHYLEDKMVTVFPYYNEMLRTSTMKYEILNNYYMTETTKTVRENDARLHGINSTVGQAFDMVTQENKGDKTYTATSKSSENHKIDITEHQTTDTDGTHTETRDLKDTEGGKTVTDDSSVKNGERKQDRETVKKFLDTPQGKLDLTDSKYLTTLNHDTENASEKVINEKVDTDTTVTHGKTLNSEGTVTNGIDDTVIQDGEQHTTNNITASSKAFQTERTKENNVLNGEHKTTADNNTRQYSHGKEDEVIEHHRVGNIGVNTDSDMIEKHLHLQKALKQIKMMFFEECEDLFMLVY